MHGTRPLERSSAVAAVFSGASSGVYPWKTIPVREDWGEGGRRIYVGSESQAHARAQRLGIPLSEVRRL